MAESTVRVQVATGRRWDDVVEVFGTRGDPSWCWCQFFVTTGDGYTKDPAANRADLQGQLASRNPPYGLVATVNGTPAGWLQFGPRTAFPRLTSNRAESKVLAEAGIDDTAAGHNVWRTTCFVVRVGMRRKGVAGALLDAAIDEVRRRGATTLEGHPVDVDALPGKAHSANLYHGVLSTFAAAGFHEIGRTAPARPMVRLTL